MERKRYMYVHAVLNPLKRVRVALSGQRFIFTFIDQLQHLLWLSCFAVGLLIWLWGAYHWLDFEPCEHPLYLMNAAFKHLYQYSPEVYCSKNQSCTVFPHTWTIWWTLYSDLQDMDHYSHSTLPTLNARDVRMSCSRSDNFLFTKLLCTPCFICLFF